jgi:hypothetical protein
LCVQKTPAWARLTATPLLSWISASSVRDPSATVQTDAGAPASPPGEAAGGSSAREACPARRDAGEATAPSSPNAAHPSAAETRMVISASPHSFDRPCIVRLRFR